MHYLSAILLGIVEGVTEFLPISSTGHLIIAEQWLGARSDLFNIVIQAGAIIAVTLVYWRRIWGLISGLREREQLAELERVGVDAVLIGESLIASDDPAIALEQLTGGHDADVS